MNALGSMSRRNLRRLTKRLAVLAAATLFFASGASSHAATVAYDGFNYTGGLVGKNTGTGFGANAWAAVAGTTDPALVTGSMTYADAFNPLQTVGNKVAPTSNSRATRNFASPLATANQTYWISFRINQTDTGTFPSNHAGFSLFEAVNGGGTNEIFMGKFTSATNWGVAHTGTSAIASGSVTPENRNALLVYKLTFTSTQATIQMWVNPTMNETRLGTPAASLTKAHTWTLGSLRVSSGTNSVNYQYDEFRMGTTFSDIVPVQPEPTETVITMTDSGSATTNGTNLQTEINNAANRAGPTRIVVPAGVTFSKVGSSISLPNKTLDNAYTTIESSQMASLPPAGERATGAQASLMPKVVSITNNTPVIATSNGAHHYRLRGLDLHSTLTTHWQVGLALGSDTNSVPANVPHHIDLDRCYVHTNPAAFQTCVHALSVHGANMRILGCDVSDIRYSSDAQSVWMCNGTGPTWIVNNFLEATGENFMSGGGGAWLSDGSIPTDVTFRRNHAFKDTTWMNDGPADAIKNSFEIKFGKRFDIQGNYFQNSWYDTEGPSQDFSIVIKVDGQGDSHNNEAKNVTQDILFKDNRINHGAGGLALQGRDWSANWQPSMDRITIVNNLFEDINRTTWGAGSGAAGSNFYFSHGPKNVIVNHNTGFHERYFMVFDTNFPCLNLQLINNVGQANPQWNPKADVHHLAVGGGTQALVAAAPGGYTFLKNILMGTSHNTFTGTDLTGNWWPTSWSGVLDNQAGGDYDIVTGSIYDNAGTDGKDPGANLPQVYAATANCVDGKWLAPDVVLYPAEAPVKVDWAATADATAAGGAYIGQSHSTQAKIDVASATPASYFEMTFNAQAGVPYHIWCRGKALNNDWQNDSAHLQFNQSVDAAGAAKWRIGTTASTVLFLEEGSGIGVSGWGWNDNNYGAVSTDYVYFSTSGKQTLRVQQREDGFQIDQIVISPCTYLHDGTALASPGTTKNDTTILIRQQ